MPEEELQLWRLLTDCVDELRETVMFSGADEHMEAFLYLTAHQAHMMQMVYRLTRNAPDGIPLKILAEKMQMSSSAASLMVETLVQKDALERLHSSLDRRMVLIRISKCGREELLRIEASYRSVMKSFLERLPEHARNELPELLTQLLTNVRDFGVEMSGRKTY